MTRMNHLPHPSIVGFERMFDVFQNMVTEKSTYPPHNIIKGEDENTYTIELAVAGFNENEVDITLDKNILNIRGEKTDKDERVFLHRGIATRSFHKAITLSETIEVKGAEMHSGILVIHLRNNLPEERKPKRIYIGQKTEKTLLQE